MPERRRRRLVDRFQHKLIVRMVFYGAVYQFTLWNFLFFWRLLQTGGGNLFQQYGQFSKEFAPMLLCMLILIPPIVWDAVKFYHRIAGPIVRIKKALRDIAEGRSVGYVQLRDNDELMELQDEFNEMLDSLSRSGAVTLISQVQADGTNKPSAGGDSFSDTIDEEVSYVSN
ncbi:MAG: HAMP domain-containing protein [Pirellulaceae bacterium]